MRKTGSGRIINITSLTVKTLLENSVLSTSLRLGVTGMAKILSDELGPDHITVNNVAPGLILTDRVKDTLHPRPGISEEELLAERARSIPLRRIGRPEELAALVAFLASPLAAYITGATIPVDGGATRSHF
jgi:3-oxoacyl-[acyl-carrier protein] reductase